MSIFDKIFNSKKESGSSEKKKNLSGSIHGSELFSSWLSASKITNSQALAFYKESPLVFSCVRAIANGASRVKLRVYKGEEEVENELSDLFKSPNQGQSGRELIYTISSHLDLTGNAYLYKMGSNGEAVSSESEIPTELIPLVPKNVRIVRSGRSELDKIIGYEYTQGARKSILEAYQVIHIKLPNPSDPYVGMGIPEGILAWLETDQFSSKVILKFFANGTRLAGILETDINSEEQLEELKQSFQEVYQGAENAYSVAVLPEGAKYQELGQNPKDMDFPILDERMQKKIMMAFQVSKTILGGTEDVNRATAEAARAVFAQEVIKPKLEIIEEKLNEELAHLFGNDISLAFDNPIPQDRESELKEIQAGTGNQPFMSTNEARARMGLPPIKNGDEVMVSFNLSPLGAPETSKSEKKRRVKRIDKPKASDEIKEGLTKALEKTLEKQGEIKNKDATVTDNTDSPPTNELEVEHKAFVLRVTPYERRHQEILQEFNQNLKTEVIKNIDKQNKDKTFKVKSDLFDSEKAIGALVDLSTPIMEDLFKKQAKKTADYYKLTIPEEILTDNAREAIKRAMNLMSESYTETTRADLEALFENAINEGASLYQIKKEVNDLFDGYDGERAAKVARTESFRIANDAGRAAMKESGVVKSLKWYTAEDERTCEFCGSMNDKIVGIDESFFKLGDSVEGSDGGKLDLTYDDVNNPPLHVNCRCMIRPEEISIE